MALDFFLNAAYISEQLYGKTDERTLQFLRRYQALKIKHVKKIPAAQVKQMNRPKSANQQVSGMSRTQNSQSQQNLQMIQEYSIKNQDI